MRAPNGQAMARHQLIGHSSARETALALCADHHTDTALPYEEISERRGSGAAVVMSHQRECSGNEHCVSVGGPVAVQVL